jgi:hypothetical protein
MTAAIGPRVEFEAYGGGSSQVNFSFSPNWAAAILAQSFCPLEPA